MEVYSERWGLFFPFVVPSTRRPLTWVEVFCSLAIAISSGAIGPEGSVMW